MTARLPIAVDPKADLPPSEQLVQQICFAVAAVALAEGERLPSVRVLAAQALVNPNTVGKAWRDLERLGVLDSRPGDGVFVAVGARARALRLRDAILGENLTRWIDDAAASGLTRTEIEDCFAAGMSRRRGWKRMGESA